MAIIKIETPDGIKQVEIEGDAPTEEEQLSIEETFFQPTASASTEEIVRSAFRSSETREESESESEKFTPTHEGEIQDHGFQFFYGRADNALEREARLTETFGENSFIKISDDDYALNLDNIAPELKERYDLPENGTIRVNKPGLSWYDVSGFFGAEAAPLGMALGAGLTFTGVGVFPGMLLMAAAGGAGKAIDELIFEKFEGLQRQTDDQIYGDIATTAALYGAGELVGRGVFAAGRYLLRGPGPKPDASRVASLIAASGGELTERQATIIAREEAKQQLRGAVKEGARPTVTEASGKAIAGRIQAIYEGIFPNAKAAAANRSFIDDTLKQLAAGDITEESAKAALNRNAEQVTTLISNAMKNANVDDAARLAERHVKQVIENEFKVITDLYNPNVGLSTSWQQALNQSARLFEQDTSILYRKAQDLLVDAEGKSLVTFSNKFLTKAIREIQGDKATSAVLGDTFNKGLFKFIKDTDTFTLTELNSLRSSLRMASRDPSLTPGVIDKQIGQMVKAIDETIDNKLQSLAMLRASGGSKTALGDMVQKQVDEQTLLLDQGIRAFEKANTAYRTGIQRFKQGAIGMLDKNLKEGVLFGYKPVLENIVQPGNATQLQAFLKAVTPSGRSIGGITSAPASAFDDAARLALNGDIKGANAALRDAGVPDDIIPKIPEFVQNLKPTDPHFRDVVSQFASTMREYSKFAGTRANPLAIRNSVRDSLAREWLAQAARTSKTAGEFDGVSFMSKFDELGGGVQNLLFGKENAQAIRSLSRDYLMIGNNGKKISEAVSETLGTTAGAIRARAEGLTGGRSVKDTIAELKNITKISQEQSEDALFQAVKNGRIQNADDLVEAVLKSPKNYDRLVAQFGDDVLNGPLNVKDMVMSRIINSAFPEGVSADAVASGAWGLPMRKTLTQLNKNGSVSKIIGQDTVNDLIKLTRLGERISDSSLKSKVGLAAAAFAAGAGMRLITEPIRFIGEASGIFLMGRMMRSKPFLNFLLKPNYSAGFTGRKVGRGGAKLYQKGIAAGADLGPINPTVLNMKEQINRQARLIAATMAKPDSDTRQQFGEAITETIEQIGPAVQQIGPAVQQIGQQISSAPPNPNQQIAQLGPDALRQLEQEKLLGVA